jgi:hypothetical protein
MITVVTVLIILAVILFVFAIGNAFVRSTVQAELLQNCVYSIALSVGAIFLVILAYVLKTW